MQPRRQGLGSSQAKCHEPDRQPARQTDKLTAKERVHMHTPQHARMHKSQHKSETLNSACWVTLHHMQAWSVYSLDIWHEPAFQLFQRPVAPHLGATKQTADSDACCQESVLERKRFRTDATHPRTCVHVCTHDRGTAWNKARETMPHVASFVTPMQAIEWNNHLQDQQFGGNNRSNEAPIMNYRSTSRCMTTTPPNILLASLRHVYATVWPN